MRFPAGFGELDGQTFDDVFYMEPKWTEYVFSTWTDNCTGLFKEFRDFIMEKLSDPEILAEHKNRCRQYVKDIQLSKLPGYLLKYKK